jgi:branched-subunit amino acid aminotransferase/4-amino-4-deoxychorismate lyase
MLQQETTAMQIFLNGKMVPQDQALINVQDAGLQHGVGLFETMAVHYGNVYRLYPHLDRLRESAQALGLFRELNLTALVDAVNRTIDTNQLQRARIRLTLTPGPVSLLKPAAPDAAVPEGTILIVPGPPTVYDPAYFEEGIKVLVAPAMANPMDPTHGHKTLNYWQRLRTLRQAATLGAGEAIWLNVTNHLASGCISNVFVVKDGRVITPIAKGEEVQGALPAPVLPGITRAAVVELAEKLGLRVEKRMVSVSELIEADEVFLTNSSWDILPVTSVEAKQVGTGKVGPVTGELRRALLDDIRDQCELGEDEPG